MKKVATLRASSLSRVPDVDMLDHSVRMASCKSAIGEFSGFSYHGRPRSRKHVGMSVAHRLVTFHEHGDGRSILVASSLTLPRPCRVPDHALRFHASEVRRAGSLGWSSGQTDLAGARVQAACQRTFADLALADPPPSARTTSYPRRRISAMSRSSPMFVRMYSIIANAAISLLSGLS
jgi:hypothetical protein